VSVSVQLSVGGQPVPDAFYDAITKLEVEESSDQPGTLLLQVPVNRTSAGDLQFVGDGTFEPMTSITLTVTPSASGSSAQCIFDGYVLSWRLHLERSSTSSTMDVWAQDASWLMNMDDAIVEWSGLTDGEVANSIFSTYGFTPAGANTDNDSPAHTDDGHTLFQRATDLQFLRSLARRNGKLCRVACTDTAGSRTAYFVTPSFDAQPTVTISLVDPDSWAVDSLDFDWDVMRPSQVDASQVDLTQASGQGTDVSTGSSGLPALGARDYPTYLGTASTLQLTGPADVPELDLRTAAVLVDSGCFARCSGEADVDRLGALLRVGDVVSIEGAGSIQSGTWLVWEVRHRFSLDAWKMQFTLVRNAMGPPAAGGSLATLANSSAGTPAVPSP
jgi:hypothetical protein